MRRGARIHIRLRHSRSITDRFSDQRGGREMEERRLAYQQLRPRGSRNRGRDHGRWLGQSDGNEPARSHAAGARGAAVHDRKRLWRHRQRLFAGGQARLRGCAFVLRFQVWLARLRGSAARSCAQDRREHSGVQFLSRFGGCGKLSTGSGAARRFDSRAQYGADADVCAAVGSQCCVGGHQSLFEIDDGSDEMQKPRLSFWQIWNMSFGFMGIQFGWGLQLANMSGIYTYLGASPDAVPLLWLAGPMTGLLVQPIVGSMSDRTWNRLGRRRPYFLTGAILASIALFFMPDSSALLMAAGLLWILDASINVSMEPFRAFVRSE